MRYSALTISTRCCTPTGKSFTIASGSTAKPYCCDNSLDASGRPSHVDPAARLTDFIAEHDVFGDGKHGDQHEVLVHHADALGDGIVRIEHRTGLAVDENLAAIGLVEAVEHVHQRGLARAVFAQQGVNLALFQSQIDVVVGEHARESLGDAACFKSGGRSWASAAHTAHRQRPAGWRDQQRRPRPPWSGVGQQADELGLEVDP